MLLREIGFQQERVCFGIEQEERSALAVRNSADKLVYDRWQESLELSLGSKLKGQVTDHLQAQGCVVSRAVGGKQGLQ